MDKKTVAAGVAGAGLGTTTLFLVKELDKRHGPVTALTPYLGDFSKPSTLVGILGGGLVTAVGIYSVITGKPLRDEKLQAGTIGFGIPLFVGTIVRELIETTPTGASAVMIKPTSTVTIRPAAPAQPEILA